MYRHLITIERMTRVQTPFGWSEEPTTVGSHWAAIYPASAELRLQYTQMEQTVTHKVHLKGSPDVRVNDTVMFGTRRLRVVGVLNPGELGRRLDLVCEEINPQS